MKLSGFYRSILHTFLLALYFGKIHFLAWGLIGIILIALIFEQKIAQDQQHPLNNNNPIDTYHPSYRATELQSVHDKSLGPSASAQRTALKSQILSNVKEHNHYMGENLGVPDPKAAEEFMFGGTRYPSANNNRSYREHPFFTAESRAAIGGVTYTPVIPVNEI